MKKRGQGRTFNFEKVKERDNSICRKCGANLNLEVHHIKPLYLGGDNSTENLITLCERCHFFTPDNCDDFPEFLKKPIEEIVREFFDKKLAEKNDER